jgi:hypothetical protein
MSDLTVHEKLLLAANDLEVAGKPQFTGEDLVVAAWERDPDTFGLSGHPDDATGKPRFPNSNRVFAEIMGSKPLRKQGLIAKTGTKAFTLTEAGRQRASLLTGRASVNGARKVSLSRETVRDIQKLLTSRAVQKLHSEREDEITFTDASGFWGINARSSAMEFAGRTQHVESVLNAAAAHASDGPIALRHGGSQLSERDVNALLALHHEMLERFSGEIAYIKKRTDER